MAQYLPVLLVSVSAVSSANPAPDDSSLDTQAIGQVDYLSHDWQEEDVAKSWRNMTRRKDSIQNGARLENASWRTWWKQRNNLPTVSPETLNWLKDSDVTWLYGPLHTAADWAPPPRYSPERGGGTSSPTTPSPRHSTLHPSDVPRSHSSRSNSPWALKPILKHRSISELLSISLPPSPGSDSMDLEDEHGYFGHATLNGNTQGPSRSKAPREAAEPDEARKRPKLTHTKSDTHIHQRNPFRRESPPLPLGSSEDASTSISPPARSRENSPGDSATTQKRHISFNTFVEQCIAIEKPKKTKDGFYGTVNEEDENDIDIDEYRDDYREDEDSDEEDESEDDVLEMRSSARSRGLSIRRTPSLSGTSTASGLTSLDGFAPSSEREHVTIAPIAPTMLKTSASASPADSYLHGGYGSLWEEEEIEDEEALFAFRRHQSPPSERTDTVNLVYVPPQGSVYAERAGISTNGNGVNGGSKAFGFPLSSPPQLTEELRTASFDDVDLLASRKHDLQLAQPLDTAFDFLSRPDLGGVVDYSLYRSDLKQSGRSPAQSQNTGASNLQSRIASDATIRQAEEVQSTAHSKGSSGSVSEEGTVMPPSLPSHSSPRASVLKSSREVQPSSPVRAPAHSAAPPPSPAIPVPHHHGHHNQSPSPAPSLASTGTTSSTTSGGSASSYNSSPVESARGRSTSPITSASACGENIRGRGSGRGGSNSVADRERREGSDRDPPRGRSRSRSTGTGSPLDGSVSPRSGSRSRLGTGARKGSLDGGGGIGLGTYGLGASPTWRDKSLSPEENEEMRRGVRVRSSRSKRSGGSGIDSSVSPPSSVRAKAVVDDSDSPPTHLGPRTTTETFDNVAAHIEVADAARSTNPTPSNSPTSAFKPLAPSSPPASVATASSAIPAPPSADDTATLVGRAVDIVSSAKGYLGSFWGGGERQAHHTRDGSGASYAPLSR